MAEQTAIGWCDATWNPWRGCHKVSAGCANCYMFRDQLRHGNDPDVVVRAKDATFYAPVKWQPGLRIFTCSWSDWFIEEADSWRPEAWDIILGTPQKTYLILTKRPELIRSRLPDDWGQGYPNVWLGVSVEDQATADERIPPLLETPAAHRWVSVEPLLGPLTFSWPTIFWALLDWAVLGGESGPNHRPMELAWLESAVEQCDAAGIPAWIKQDSGRYPGRQGRLSDKLWARKETP